MVALRLSSHQWPPKVTSCETEKPVAPGRPAPGAPGARIPRRITGYGFGCYTIIDIYIYIYIDIIIIEDEYHNIDIIIKL